jgi:1,3-beta-glucan synthase
MFTSQALTTVYADYIGRHHANYRKWCFAAQLDLDNAVGCMNDPGLQNFKSVMRRKPPVKSSGDKSPRNVDHR